MAERPLRVIVAGAGPVGLSLALALARRGVEVDVLEAEPSLSAEARASTLHPPTLEMFDEWGVAETILARGARVDRLQYWDRPARRLVAELPYALLADDTPFPFRLQCPQHEVTPVLAAALEATGRGRIHYGHRVVACTLRADAVDVAAETDDGPVTLSGTYLCGADGSRSAVRAALGLTLHGKTYPDRFLLIGSNLDLERWFPAMGPVSYVFDPEEWVVVMRLPALVRTVFRLAADDDADAAQTDAAVRDRLARFVGEPVDVELRMRAIYSVHQRVAEAFRVGRVLLAGDAAHVNNPAGGMGMNSGIHDAYHLAAAIAEGTDAALDRYAIRRRQVAIDAVQQTSDDNYRRMTARDPNQRRARDAELRDIAADPARARAFLRRAAMLDPAVRP